MQQKSIAIILKSFTFITACIAGVFFFWYIPLIIEQMSIENHIEFLLWRGKIGIWLIAFICYVALYLFWKICTEIGHNHSFCEKNARMMNGISFLAFLVSLLIFIGDVYLSIFHYLNGAVVIFSFFVIFVGIGISILCFALSKLIMNATMIQEENDLTI